MSVPSHPTPSDTANAHDRVRLHTPPVMKKARGCAIRVPGTVPLRCASRSGAGLKTGVPFPAAPSAWLASLRDCTYTAIGPVSDRRLCPRGQRNRVLLTRKKCGDGWERWPVLAVAAFRPAQRRAAPRVVPASSQEEVRGRLGTPVFRPAQRRVAPRMVPASSQEEVRGRLGTPVFRPAQRRVAPRVVQASRGGMAAVSNPAGGPCPYRLQGRSGGYLVHPSPAGGAGVNTGVPWRHPDDERSLAPVSDRRLGPRGQRNRILLPRKKCGEGWERGGLCPTEGSETAFC